MVNEIFEQFTQPYSPMKMAPGATPKEFLEQDLDITPYDLQLSAIKLAKKHLLLIEG